MTARGSSPTFLPGRSAIAVVLASFLVTATWVSLNQSRTGDLSRWYTDHIHHNYATWIFLHRGWDIYRLPLGESKQNVTYPQAAVLWEQNPMVYPPGVFAVFLPTTLVGRFIPMSAETFARLNVLVMLAIAHVALWSILRVLQHTQPGSRTVMAIIVWMYLARLGMQGFFDGAWIAAGAWVLWALIQKKPARALVYFGLASLLHYRAVVLMPLGLFALYECIRDRSPRQWPWPAIVATGFCVSVCLGTFALMYPVTAQFRHSLVPLYQSLSPRFWAIALVTLSGAALAARWADGITSAITVGAGALGVIEVNYWWHGAVVLFAPLAVDVARRAIHPSAARSSLIAWLFCVQPLAWQDAPTQIFIEMTDHFRWRWK